MEDRKYSFFQHRDCEFFPCHDIEELNCLFCFCPLYMTGDKCGGSFTCTREGIKDCSGCVYPHIRENYDRIIQRLYGKG